MDHRGRRRWNWHGRWQWIRHGRQRSSAMDSARSSTSSVKSRSVQEQEKDRGTERKGTTPGAIFGRLCRITSHTPVIGTSQTTHTTTHDNTRHRSPSSLTRASACVGVVVGAGDSKIVGAVVGAGAGASVGWSSAQSSAWASARSSARASATARASERASVWARGVRRERE